MGRAFVVDASALIDELVEGRGPDALMRADVLHAPNLIDYEFLSAARRLAGQSPIVETHIRDALESFAALEIERHPAAPFITRIWSLRTTFTSYDASYVALAEALGVPLLTTDRRLARAAASYCDVES